MLRHSGQSWMHLQSIAAKTGLTILEVFYTQKHFPENICLSEVKQQLSYKYVGNFRFIFKLFSKVWE